MPGGCRVFYASVRESDINGSAGAARHAENRSRLAGLLWEHLRAQDTPLWKNHPIADSTAGPLQIVHDALGCPRLPRGEHAGPSISFSRAGEEIWGALSCDESAVGIDVAGCAEFRGDYPVRRAFHAQELEQALNVTGGDVASAMALLWSVKEAVVKALGCAFHLVDPLDLQVQHEGVEEGWHVCSVSLSGKALVRYPMEGRQPISLRSVSQADAWLSIAAVRLPQRPHSG